MPLQEIVENGYDLTFNRYKEIEYEPEEFDPPGEIIKRMREIELKIQEGLDEIEGMLS